ncbi:hypothetical protein O1W71_07020 [Microbacterium sp. H37-C3]|uniref:hypothetical protein n=1 Tax=Microbacterium sp. H37-C3 TaxID=3004354 RepID=UPI0022AE9BED|nr:hypothetical protein [Microbacterium sp. H37-C3]MCZ4067417.1 hypothetical protein [Microbacterium sp. H37-C3]
MRADVLGQSYPEFSVVLPDGWEEFTTTQAAQAALMGRASERLSAAHRPELAAQLRAITTRAFSKMRATGTERFYIQTRAWSNDLLLPLSITASVREATAQKTLDAQVADLIRTRGATALRDDRRFVRWESESTLALGTERARQYTTTYLTPIPGTERREALHLVAVAVAPADGSVPRSHPLVAGMFELSDAVVSTLHWSTR